MVCMRVLELTYFSKKARRLVRCNGMFACDSVYLGNPQTSV